MRTMYAAIVAVLLAGSASRAKLPHEIWNIKLTGEGGVLTFERPRDRIWTRQQGVLFLTPERLAIYQVNRTLRLAPLRGRSSSGGGGNFFLLVRIFDTHTGQEIRRMQLLTTAEYSSIAATHDGRFMVRTGNLVSLFSRNFDLLLSRELPLMKEAEIEYWQVGVTSSGDQIALVHQQRFMDLGAVQAGGLPLETKSEADVEMLDADTFQTIRKLHLPHYLPTWSATDRSLLTLPPPSLLTRPEFGLMDFEGRWAAVRLPKMQAYHDCSPNMDLLQHDLMAARGCGGLVVFSDSGEQVLTLPERQTEQFESVAGADHYLAIETAEFVQAINGLPGMQPSEIQVYDLESRENTMSVKAKTPSVAYAVSTEGVLAVVDGNGLKVYQPH
jgi:hypothetical protein